MNLFILLLIGYIGILNFNIKDIYILQIFSIFLELLYYSFISLLLIKVFDNLFIVMVPIIGKFMSLYLIDSKNELSKVILFWFPSSYNSNIIQTLTVIIEIIFLFLIIIWIEINKDY